MSRDKSSMVWVGLGLISLGIVLMFAQLIGWEKIWPIFPLLGGVAFLVGYVVGGFKESGLVFVGVGAILVGLFFFAFTLGTFEWGDMGTLWPIFLLIGGLAFCALFLAERGRDLGTLGVGCVAFVVGLVGLAITLGLIGTDIVKYWPLLLIFLGLVVLVGGLFQLLRRE